MFSKKKRGHHRSPKSEIQGLFSGQKQVISKKKGLHRLWVSSRTKELHYSGPNDGMSFTTSAPKSLLGAVFNFGAKSASKALKSAILHTLQAKASPPHGCATVPYCSNFQRWSRGRKARGHGQGQRDKKISRPRTDPLEAKAKAQGHRRKCSPKKKLVFKKFFQAIQEKGLQKNFKAKKVFKKFFFQAIFT